MLQWLRKLLIKLGLIKADEPERPVVKNRNIDLDELSRRNEIIRKLTDTDYIKKTELKKELFTCPSCGARVPELHTCCKCGKAVCEECGTICGGSVDMVGGMADVEKEGYYCEDCW